MVLIAGDGPQLAVLKRLAISLGINERFLFLGWRDDIPQLIKGADIVVMPSVCEEGFPYFIEEC
ncbi:MAG: glycosyltransferase [Candidatus Hodarchaeales archaeon]